MNPRDCEPLPGVVSVLEARIRELEERVAKLESRELDNAVELIRGMKSILGATGTDDRT